MREQVENLFKSHDVKLNFRKIKEKLNVNFSCDEDLLSILKELELSGTIYQNDDGIYSALPDNFFINEVLFTSKGIPFIKKNNKHIYLDSKKLDGILPNDIVVFTENNDGLIPIKILKRKNEQVVCEVKQDSKNKKYLEVCNTKTHVIVRIDNKDMKGLTLGERVLVHITPNKYGVSYQARFIKRMGHKNDFDTELATIAINNGFLTEYPKEILDEIESIPDSITSDDLKGRVDKRNDFIFTIDGEHTKDIDDAVELKMLEGGNYLLTVSIAHVSHYVKPGSSLWRFAESNTTSLYLVDHVLAMLHTKLSNGICSLNPEVDRLARSFEIEINPFGDVVNFKTYPSVICSKKKMTYEKINDILERDIVDPDYKPYVENLKLMEQLSNLLSLKRKNAGAVDFSSKEISFSVDADGNIEKHVTKQGPAEKIIENFMVLTNSCVGKYFHDLFLPFIYRNHELPVEQIIEDTCKLLNNFGYKLDKINGISDPLAIQKMIRSLSQKEEFIVLSVIILKTMQKAYYGSKSTGHFGLALDYYSQSTSPIRRFLDLVIHTLIDYYEGLESDLAFSSYIEEYLEESCKNASIKERCADKAEYEANELYMAKYMQNHIGEEFYGYISSVNSSYIGIKTEGLIDGYVSLNLFDLGFIYYPESKMIVNKEKSITLHIGSKLKVKLMDVDLANRLIIFDIIEPNLTKDMIRTRKK